MLHFEAFNVNKILNSVEGPEPLSDYGSILPPFSPFYIIHFHLGVKFSSDEANIAVIQNSTIENVLTEVANAFKSVPKAVLIVYSGLICQSTANWILTDGLLKPEYVTERISAVSERLQQTLVMFFLHVLILLPRLTPLWIICHQCFSTLLAPAYRLEGIGVEFFLVDFHQVLLVIQFVLRLIECMLRRRSQLRVLLDQLNLKWLLYRQTFRVCFFLFPSASFWLKLFGLAVFLNRLNSFSLEISIGLA